MDCATVVATHAVVRSWSIEPSSAIEIEVAQAIAEQFDIGPVLRVERFRERGNINLHTFLVITANEEYLLQRLNSDVFAFPHRVMDSMIQWCQAQSQAVQERTGCAWEPITLVPTLDNKPYLDFRIANTPNVWRMMVRIANTTTYKSLSEVEGRAAQLELAEQVGRGLALSADLTVGLNAEELAISLPGYRDTYGYFAQFEAVLGGHRTFDRIDDQMPEDEDVRACTQALYLLAPTLGEAEAEERRHDPELRPYIELVRQSKSHGLKIAEALATGQLRRTAIHGDTKIENFLFDRDSGQVRSLIDLDTVMPYTWLADWGDCLRSLCNVAGEKTRDLDSVQVDLDVYEAVARGFLSTVRNATNRELALLADAVEIIALELGTRFLTDYLRGDNYFMLGDDDPADLNRTRGMVQLTLYQRLREARPEIEALIARLSG